jgi:hypothetical protein
VVARIIEEKEAPNVEDVVDRLPNNESIINELIIIIDE